MAKRKALFMICLLAVAFGLTALVAVLAEKDKKKEKAEELLCVTSFYPVQLLAEAVSEGAEGVTVRNLTENHSGCIHDYTLTTQDMRLLSEAELFLINGGEMELFLQRAASEYKDLKIVDTSAGYAFLEGVEHDHDHGEETEEHSAESCTDPAHNHEDEEHSEELCKDPAHDHEEHAATEEDHDGHSHAVNAHIWMDIDGYLLQLSRVEEAFAAADPAQEKLYRANAEACRGELAKLAEEYAAAKTALSGKETVVFHEGFVYLLNMLGVESVHCLAMDSDTQIAAGEAAEIMEECKRHGITVLFAEAEYAGTVSDTFAKELSGEAVVLDPVTGKWSDDSAEEGAFGEVPEAGTDHTGEADESPRAILEYCARMRKNLEMIQQAYDLQ